MPAHTLSKAKTGRLPGAGPQIKKHAVGFPGPCLGEKGQGFGGDAGTVGDVGPVRSGASRNADSGLRLVPSVRGSGTGSARVRWEGLSKVDAQTV